MPKPKLPTSKPKLSKVDSIKLQALIFGLVLFAASFYETFKIPSSGRQLIPFSLVFVILGVTFESARLAGKWINILLIIIGSLIISFFCSLLFSSDSGYNFEKIVEVWPYSFIIIFTIISIAFHGKKLISKLSEGATLIQSLAVIYWLADHGFTAPQSIVLKVLMIIGVIFSLYTVFHAFSYTPLSNRSRLILSIWSSVIMMLFAIDNIYSIYYSDSIESSIYLVDQFYMALVYFLLGVSTIYIVKNILMLTGFLPGKDTFFNSEYFRLVKELKEDHINRYSDKQVRISHSLFCIIICGITFILNFFYELLPSNVLIWLVFLLFTLIIASYEWLEARKRKNYG